MAAIIPKISKRLLVCARVLVLVAISTSLNAQLANSQSKGANAKYDVALDSTFTPVRPQLPDRKIISEYACKNKLAQ